MKNVLKNKFFQIIILFMLFVIVFYNSALAFDITLSNNTKSNFPEIPKFPNDNYNSYIIVKPTGSYYPYYLIFYDKDKIIFNSSEHKFYSNSYNFYVYGYTSTRYSDGSIVPSWALSMTDRNYISFSSSDFPYYTTSNIKDTSGNVVFQSAPQKVEQVTIPAIQQVEEIPQMMGEVMKMIIPIGLIIFGIFLLILLVRLVISRIA